MSWRWVFFINVPIGIAAAITAAMYLREMRNQEATVKLDIVGAVLVTGSLATLIYGVVNTTTKGWTSSTTLTWFVVGAIGMIAFIFWEAKIASHPLVPFRIFRSRSLSMANLMMFLVGGAFFAMWYFLTFYFQRILGYGAVKAGFAFLPMALAIIAGAQISSRMLARVGARVLLLTGAALASVGFLFISRIQPHSSYVGAILLPAVLCAFAMGLLFTPLATTATADVDRADAGLASGVLNTSRQVGGSLSLAILGTVAADRTATFVDPHTSEALVSGYQRAFQISAVITLLALCVAVAVPRRVGVGATQ